ncbi:very short patch repair endonuclease [Myxococcus sp. AM009]|uniref:very short patch repair endonuclease n=1 Tax=Myxococcus sp. AM009 TaxID=2745137 RepID=UPI0034D20027
MRRVMQANVGRETRAEALLRNALRSYRFRFETDTRPEVDLRCSADLVFRRRKVSVFVDGCFWHGCPQHFVAPRQNKAWWAEKIAATVERDKRKSALLRARGWTVVRLWEHDVLADLDGVVAKLLGVLRAR